MFCPKCGAENPADARYCGNCATALPRMSPPAPAASTSGGALWGSAASPPGPGGGATGAETAPVVSSGLNIGIILGSLLLPFIGIIMGVIYLIDANPAKKAAGRTWLIVGIGAAVFWYLVSSSMSP